MPTIDINGVSSLTVESLEDEHDDTVGNYANALAARFAIEGGQFTLKADGVPLHPSQGIIPAERYELIEYVAPVEPAEEPMLAEEPEPEP